MSTTQAPTVQLSAKAALMSNTIQFNVLAIAALAIDILTELNLPFVGTEWFAGLVLLVNLLLRFKTERPVRMTATVVSVPQEP